MGDAPLNTQRFDHLLRRGGAGASAWPMAAGILVSARGINMRIGTEGVRGRVPGQYAARPEGDL